MTGIGIDGYQMLYESLLTARGRLRLGGKAVVTCLCGAMRRTAADSEEGQYARLDCEARFLGSDEPEKRIQLGDVVELEPYGATKWSKFRIGALAEIAGIITFVLESVNE